MTLLTVGHRHQRSRQWYTKKCSLLLPWIAKNKKTKLQYKNTYSLLFVYITYFWKEYKNNFKWKWVISESHTSISIKSFLYKWQKMFNIHRSFEKHLMLFVWHFLLFTYIPSKKVTKFVSTDIIYVCRV